jgi:hypothetical protein
MNEVVVHGVSGAKDLLFATHQSPPTSGAHPCAARVGKQRTSTCRQRERAPASQRQVPVAEAIFSTTISPPKINLRAGHPPPRMTRSINLFESSALSTRRSDSGQFLRNPRALPLLHAHASEDSLEVALVTSRCLDVQPLQRITALCSTMEMELRPSYGRPRGYPPPPSYIFLFHRKFAQNFAPVCASCCRRLLARRT